MVSPRTEFLASPDRFYFGYLIGLYGSTSGFTIPDTARFARGTSLWRVSNEKISVWRPQIEPLIELSMIYICTMRCRRERLDERDEIQGS